MSSGSKLGVCGACGGFFPARASVCVHCKATSRPLFDRLRIGALGGSFGGGAIAFTLMACYGMPPCDDGTRDCHYDDGDGGSASDAARDARLPDVQVTDASTGASDADSDADGDGGDDADAGPDGG